MAKDHLVPSFAEEESLPQIIGTYSDTGYDKISQILRDVGGKKIRVRNPLTAEFCKLTDNAFRSTLFSYSNELAMYASELGINAREVLNAVNDNYPPNDIPPPAYVSGYCLTKDPYLFELNFLKYKKKRDFQSVWYYGRKTNDYLIMYTVLKILEHLKDPASSCVAILGLSFKEDSDDFRMSHSIDIIRSLINQGVKKFKVYDPYLETNKYTMLPKDLSPYITASGNTLTQDILTGVDAIIVASMHKPLREISNTDLEHLLEKTKSPCYLFDGYNIWESAKKSSHIQYDSLGQSSEKQTNETFT